MEIKVFSDGGSRGNPGNSGFGVVIKNGFDTIFEYGDYIGIKTNNEAEYAGVIGALSWLVQNQSKYTFTKITFIMDSQLLCRQLQGKYKVKAPHLKILKLQADNLISKLNCPIVFTDVLRENNQRADELANLAMDAKSKVNV